MSCVHVQGVCPRCVPDLASVHVCVAHPLRHPLPNPSSLAATLQPNPQAAYEASFGPFYRVEQMILATQPPPPPSRQPPPAASGAPPPPASSSSAAAAAAAILSGPHLQLLFDMQQLVDELEGGWWVWAGRRGRPNPSITTFKHA